MKKIGTVAVCGVILWAAALSMTACGGENNGNDNKGGTEGEYREFNLYGLMSDGNVVWYKFNGVWYEDYYDLQAAMESVLGDNFENATAVTKAGGKYYMEDQMTEYVEYNGAYYEGDRHDYDTFDIVHKIGDDYFEQGYSIVYRTGTEGNYTYSNENSGGATQVYKYTKVDGTFVYFEQYQNYKEYRKLDEGVFAKNDDLKSAYRFGTDTKYYTDADQANGTLKQAYRTGTEGSYIYYDLDTGIRFDEGVYYEMERLTFYCKVK